MATTADFRNGLCIMFKDDLYRIVQFQHVKPGKGPAAQPLRFPPGDGLYPGNDPHGRKGIRHVLPAGGGG